MRGKVSGQGGQNTAVANLSGETRNHKWKEF